MRVWCYWLWLLVLVFGDAVELRAGGSRRLSGMLSADGRMSVGSITTAGHIQLYRGQGMDWKAESITIPDGNLIPDAPLILLPGTPDQPDQIRILSVASDGRFLLITVTLATDKPVEMTIRSTEANVTPFPVRTSFSCVESSSTMLVYAINLQGQLVELDPVSSAISVVEERAEMVLPGGSVRTRDNNSDELFLVDRRGNLVCYVRDPIRRWRGPQLIGTGFQAGSDLAIWRRPDGAQEDYVAGVDALGELRLMRHESAGWRMEIAPGWLLPPGTPISVFHTPINIRFVGITAAGMLQEMHLLNTEWRQKRLGTGYHPQHANFMPSHSLVSVSIDAAGDLLTATNAEEVWTSLLTPADNSGVSGTVISRDWSPPEYQSRDFRLWNSSTDDLVIRHRDRRQLGSSQDLLLGQGQQITLPFDCEKQRTLTTELNPPAPSATAADTTASDVPAGDASAADTGTPTANPVVRSATTRTDGPIDLEVLKPGRGLSYQDVRLHQFPRVRSSDSAEISLGRFAVSAPEKLTTTGVPPDAESPPKIVIEIDVVKSAANRQLTPPAAPANP